MSTYRYPGTRSFQAEDAAIFYGREKDRDRLLRLLLLEQVVVLYGKSGLGKSSLLNAGVLPKLEQQATVEEVRFGGFVAEDPIAPLSVLEQQLWDAPLHPLIAQLGAERSDLWCRAKSRELSQENDQPLYLVFDQFEELFTYPPATVQEFKSALAALLQEGSPLWVQQILSKQARTQPDTFSKEDRQKLLAPLSTKVLLIVRSDHLSLLHQFTSHFPNVLVNLHELKPLSAQQARTAIIQPAQNPAEHFATPPFSYSPAAVQLMLASLANERGEIESFQLQLLCQYLEDLIRQDPALVLIEPNHLGGPDGIQDILQGYYERQIAALPEGEQEKARRFIEEGLIIDGRRAALTAGAEQQRYDVSPALLQQLLDSRLIRAENIHLGKIYELSHDTLIEPVTKSLEQRKAIEEKRRIEAELRQAEEQNRLEVQRRRRARTLAILGFLLFAIAAVAGLFAWQKYQEADRNKRRADAAALAAQASTIYPQDHTLAFRIAEAALLIDSTNEDAKESLLQIANNPQTSFYQKVLTEHTFEIETVAFNQDGSLMATAGQDTKIILWSRGGEIIREYLGRLSGENQPGHKARITTLSFSTDGEKIISGSEDGSLIVWSVSSGDKLTEWPAHQSGVSSLAITVCNIGECVVSGGVDGLAHIWTLEGELHTTMSGHAAGITQVATSAATNTIMTASLDGSVRLWNRTGSFLRFLKEGDVPVNAACFINNSESVLIGLRNSLAEILSLNGQRQAVLAGHRGQITSVDAFPSVGYLLTASDDGTARVWNRNGESILSLVGHKKRLNFASCSPDESQIVTGGYDFTVKLWDVALNLDIQQHRHQNFIYCVDISEDDQKIVTASIDGSAKVWAPTGQWLADINGHANAVQTAFFVPGKPEIITASKDNTARIWTTQGEELLQLSHPSSVSIARATVERQEMITGDVNGMLRMWSADGELIRSWSTNVAGRGINWLDLNPNGDKIATAQANTVKIWDWQGQLLDSFVHELVAVIYKVEFAADGQSVYTCAQEYPVRQWSLQGENLRSLYAHTEENYWVAPHPTLPLVATAGWDQNITLWDDSGKQLTRIPHPNGVYSVDFSSDAEWLVSGSHDNVGRVWSKEGKLLAKLGERADLESLAQQGLIAPLANIPFSITETQLSQKYLDVLANGRPEQYRREGAAALAEARRNSHSLTEKLAYFDQAISWFNKAKVNAIETEREILDKDIAEALRWKGELLIINRQFPAAIQALEQGLALADRDYLLVLKTMALAYDGKVEEALQFSEQYQGRATPQIEWYTDYNEAVVNDLYFFQDQFGLPIGAADTLINRLQPPIEEE